MAAGDLQILGLFASAFSIMLTIVGAAWYLKGQFSDLRHQFMEEIQGIVVRVTVLEYVTGIKRRSRPDYAEVTTDPDELKEHRGIR